jgi:hypothetical protein
MSVRIRILGAVAQHAVPGVACTPVASSWAVSSQSPWPCGLITASSQEARIGQYSPTFQGQGSDPRAIQSTFSPQLTSTLHSTHSPYIQDYKRVGDSWIRSDIFVCGAAATPARGEKLA